MCIYLSNYLSVYVLTYIVSDYIIIYLSISVTQPVLIRPDKSQISLASRPRKELERQPVCLKLFV